MAIPSRNKIYVFVIGILLLSNIALVAFFVMNKPEKKFIHKDRPGGFMTEALRKDVGFDSSQMTRFEQMADQHRDQMRPLFEDMIRAKEKFYRQLSLASVPASALDALGDSIAQKQKNIDLRIYSHFQNIRQLCTPDQLPRFDSLVQKVVRKMMFPMRKGDARRDSLSTK